MKSSCIFNQGVEEYNFETLMEKYQLFTDLLDKIIDINDVTIVLCMSGYASFRHPWETKQGKGCLGWLKHGLLGPWVVLWSSQRLIVWLCHATLPKITKPWPVKLKDIEIRLPDKRAPVKSAKHTQSQEPQSKSTEDLLTLFHYQFQVPHSN